MDRDLPRRLCQAASAKVHDLFNHKVGFKIFKHGWNESQQLDQQGMIWIRICWWFTTAHAAHITGAIGYHVNHVTHSPDSRCQDSRNYMTWNMDEYGSITTLAVKCHLWKRCGSSNLQLGDKMTNDFMTSTDSQCLQKHHQLKSSI